jgi:hypothetical protein
LWVAHHDGRTQWSFERHERSRDGSTSNCRPFRSEGRSTCVVYYNLVTKHGIDTPGEIAGARCLREASLLLSDYASAFTGSARGIDDAKAVILGTRTKGSCVSVQQLA